MLERQISSEQGLILLSEFCLADTLKGDKSCQNQIQRTLFSTFHSSLFRTECLTYLPSIQVHCCKSNFYKLFLFLFFTLWTQLLFLLKKNRDYLIEYSIHCYEYSKGNSGLQLTICNGYLR